MRHSYEITKRNQSHQTVIKGDIVTMGARAADPTEPFIVAHTGSGNDRYQLISLIDGNRWSDQPTTLEDISREVFEIIPKGSQILLTLSRP